MSTVKEIEKAIQNLPREDFLKLREVVQHRFDDEWDREIAVDIEAGKLDEFASKALAEHRAGKSKPFPPS